MTPLFTKLNLKDQPAIMVLNAPPEFEPELAVLAGITVQRKATSPVSFAIAFVKTHAEVSAAAKAILPKVVGDAVVWFAYPKGTSKKHTCEFNRDTGWTPLGEAGFEPVRQVAIDADWSALRFRHVQFIKSMTRDPKMTISAIGKAKTKKA